jgi:low affinity Fe/Cu permease
MVQESMEASAGIQQRIARAMFQKIDERIVKMEEAEHAKKP